MPLHPLVVTALEARRAQFNTRFQQVRRHQPEVQGSEVLALCGTLLEPAGSILADLDPGAVAELVEATFETVLQLQALRLTGSRSHEPWIDTGLGLLVPAAARFLGQRPHATLCALGNALHHIGQQHPPGATQWTRRMQAVLPACDAVAQWLAAGQVLAWRCGLAQYRDAALRVLEALPAALQAALLELPAAADPAPEVAALLRHPWHRPGQPPLTQPRWVRRCGGFVGFGGPFRRPPRLAAHDGQLYASDGSQAWRWTLDACGEYRVRVDDTEWQAAQTAHAARTAPPAGWTLHEGVLRHAGRSFELPSAGAITGLAGNDHTLLVSHAASHALSVIALPA